MRNKILSILIALMLLIAMPSCNFLSNPGTGDDDEDKTEITAVDTIDGWLDSSTSIISTPIDNEVYYVPYNGNVPEFSDEERTDTSFKTNEELDELGRTGIALSSMCAADMPDYERDSLDTDPSGWQQNSYPDIVPGGWLLQRAHCRGFQYMGDQDNPKNLITGTQSFNINGMLPFENRTANHMRTEPAHHIMYRATPVYVGNELMPRAIILESDCNQCDTYDYATFIFNRQPGITIDYSDGDNWANTDNPPVDDDVTLDEATYILNTNSKTFHTLTCTRAPEPESDNYKLTDLSRDEVLDDGYKPCGFCNP